MNKKLVLTTFLLIALSIPMVSALPSDEWLIENAISGVKDEYPHHRNKEFTGYIITDWHEHPELDAPLHKHVFLRGVFGYQDTGIIRWQGRSYAEGGIYTTHYSNHNPDVPKLNTVVVYLGPLSFWDGSRWVKNEPQSIANSGSEGITVQVLGNNGLIKTYELAKDKALLVYPPIGVEITFSII
jgi:hypothetical protein